MKNTVTKFLFAFLISLVLVSCGKESAKNEYGCFYTIDEAAEDAKKTKKDILLIVTTGVDDVASESFVNNVMNAPEFKKEIVDKYATVNFDFSEVSYQKTVVKEDATAEEQKAAEDFANMMYENARYASLLNVQAAPAVFLLTKEKYFIDEVIFENDPLSVSDFVAVLNESAEKAVMVNAALKEAESGSAEKRLLALDTFYESVDENYKVTLAGLVDKVIDLDKDNKFGYLSKYILTKANIEASYLFLEGNIVESAQCFVEAAEKEHIEPAHAQQLYYMATYVLAMAGYSDFNVMIDYLDKAIAADPESENVEGIQMFKSYIQEIIAE